MPITLHDISLSQVLNPEDTNQDDTRAFRDRNVEPFTLPGFVTPFGYTLWQSSAERQFRLVTQGPHPETVYAVWLEETKDFYSPERAYRLWYGAPWGERCSQRGNFKNCPEHARETGRKGGFISRRRPKSEI